MRVVAEGSAQSLMGLVREAVEPGTPPDTDGWPRYSQLEGLEYPQEVAGLRNPKSGCRGQLEFAPAWCLHSFTGRQRAALCPHLGGGSDSYE